MISGIIIAAVALYAHMRGVDVFDCACKGAKRGVETALKMLPPLVCLLAAVYMLRASGLIELMAQICAPLFELLGIPPETAALIFLRPVTGSGALAVGSELIAQYGVDSEIGRTAAVMIGSTETTFYVLAVYLGAAGVKRGGKFLPAALCADLVGFITAAWAVRFFF
ncbi:MAG: spore maturation protein [Oscillospiraceae bacterium]